ncbi:MAG: bacillithiol system redox-active protein YtxJ [Lentisphaeria bacterium]|nr:bacillithiol system redox-active protein YtxJ [Lentisphaeria bacterium]
MRDLTSIEDLDEVLSLSETQPVFLFKHSTRCPISTFAETNYVNFVKAYQEDDVLFTFLDLIAHRDVSNTIAEKTGVTHQSPQAILVSNHEVIWTDTHTAITQENLAKAIAKL